MPKDLRTQLFGERTAAVSRDHAGKQEISDPLVRVNLIFHASEAMPFVLVDLVVDRAATFFDRVDDLQGLGFRAAGIVPAGQ